MKNETMTKTVMSSHPNGGSQLKGGASMRGCQPPKNMTAVSVLIRIMFMYSARKNSANVIPEYSIMWPATISDSPSTTSNGARLVSATPDTKDRKSTRLNSSHLVISY